MDNAQIALTLALSTMEKMDKPMAAENSAALYRNILEELEKPQEDQDLIDAHKFCECLRGYNQARLSEMPLIMQQRMWKYLRRPCADVIMAHLAQREIVLDLAVGKTTADMHDRYGRTSGARCFSGTESR